MPRRAVPRHREYDLDRLRGFSDSVFAVAITVLAVTFRLPEIDATSSLGPELAAEWPQYLSYLAGFVVIGFFWLSHHRLFDLIVRADGVLVLLNLVFLFFLVLIPFSTIVLGEYRSMVPAHVLFNANAAVVGFAGLGLWIRSTRDHRGVDSGLDPRSLRIYRWRAAVFPIVFSIALAACSIDEWAAVATWLLLLVGRPLVRLALGTLPPDERTLEDTERDDDDSDRSSAAFGRRQRGLGRLTGFSDNVYAFAVTVLILPLVSELPDAPLTTSEAVDAFLRDQAWSAVQPYTLGFVVIGLFWTLHVRVFGFLRAQDGTLRIITLVHLLAIATLPFATALITSYDSSPTAIIVYASTAGLCGLGLTAITFYASAHHRLIAPDVPDSVVALRRWSTVVVPTSFLLSVLVAPVSTEVAQLLWYVGFFVVRLLQRRWAARHPDLSWD